MIQVYLSGIRCVEETDEVGSDEPYVLVSVVSLDETVNVEGVPVPVPAFDVVQYGPWDPVWENETHLAPGLSQSFWGLSGAPAPLPDMNHAIVLASLIENDNSVPEALRLAAKAAIPFSLASSIPLDRNGKAAVLARDVNAAIGAAAEIAIPNADEPLGGAQEVNFSPDELAFAELGGDAVREMAFSGDGGRYTLWFVATNPFPNGFSVFGAIRDKWQALGGPNGPLKRPLTNESPTFDGTGRAQDFDGGVISWHPDIGAFAVWGLIGERWKAIGREQFGYPISDEAPTGDGVGRFNNFRSVQFEGQPEATITYHPDAGTWEVYGAIRDKWGELGWTDGYLHFPVGSEQDHPEGRFQQFQGGGLLWNRNEVVQV